MLLLIKIEAEKKKKNKNNAKIKQLENELDKIKYVHNPTKLEYELKELNKILVFIEKNYTKSNKTNYKNILVILK